MAALRRAGESPRPSGEEGEAVRTYIVGWAEDHGLKCYRDDIGNLIVKVPGAVAASTQRR